MSTTNNSNKEDSSEWQNLETIKTFDDCDGSSMSRIIQNIRINESTQLIDNSKEFDDEFISAIATRPTAPISLLVESLIQQLCSLINPDPGDASELYTKICTQLHRMNLIDETYMMSEFDLMRSQYKNTLYQLATAVRGEPELPVSLQTEPLRLIDDAQQKTGLRYHHEFEELNFIAGGGFGKVYRARHKLDGIEYAIKKITIKNTTMKRVLPQIAEVKTFASLNHANIVPYKAAWIELFFNNPNDQIRHKRKSRTNKSVNKINRSHCSSHGDESSFFEEAEEEEEEEEEEGEEYDDEDCDGESDDDDDDGNNVDSESNNVYMNKCQSEINYNDNSSSSDFIVFENSSASSIVQHIRSENDKVGTICKYIDNTKCVESTSYSNALKSQLSINESQSQLKWATLYIQMALCPLTLRTWLDERNKCDDFNLFYKNFLRQFILEQYSNYDEKSDEEPKHQGANRKASTFEECLARDWHHTDVANNIFAQLLDGVNYIHLQNIVHHDIKPSNVFIGCERNGKMYVQLGDFGLACPLKGNHPRDDIIGTALYAAPEQLAGHCNPKSDLYSLGILMLELLFPFKTYMERAETIRLAREGTFPEHIDKKYLKILKKLLQPCENRPEAEDLQRWIRKLLPMNHNNVFKTLSDSEEEDDEERFKPASKLNISKNHISTAESTDRQLNISSSSYSCNYTYNNFTNNKDSITAVNALELTQKQNTDSSELIRVQATARTPMIRELDVVKTSIDEISEKDKKIALLQSQLLEMNRKERTLEKEIERLKSKLEDRKNAHVD